MRVAVVTDIHGNLPALEAVIADLRDAAPDLILHGGDIADAGASPAAVVDCIRWLGWRGVRGNTDEMLATPESLDAFAAGNSGIRPLLATIREMADFTSEALGEERLQWLRGLPLTVEVEDAALTLVHASPQSAWISPQPESADDAFTEAYGQQPRLVAYGHVHRGFIRTLPGGLTVANCGSVSLSYDGDWRASYLLVDAGGTPVLRRVAYDREKELAALRESRIPHAGWTARMLEHAGFVMP